MKSPVFLHRNSNAYIILLVFILSACTPSKFQLREGDLLFQKWESSDFAKAINAVTEGYGKNDFAHVGMVIN